MTTPNEKLQRARLARHWSVAVASRRAGVSINTFNRWERGLQTPQLATLDQLLAAFGMTAEELGFGFVIAPATRTCNDFPMTLEEAAGREKKSPSEEEWPVSSLTKHGLADPQVGEGPLSPLISLFPLEAPITSVSYRLRGSRPAHVQPIASARAEAEAEQMSRRQIIAALIGTPAAIFCLRQGDSLSLLRAEEILTLCATHIPLCWQLYFEGGRPEVEKVLPDYIAQLSTLARHPSTYQQRAASLLSQAYQLASLLATQHQDYGAAGAAAKQGLIYGELAGEVDLQVGSLIRQALVAFYLKRPLPCLQSYLYAQRLVPHSSPLLQSRVYLGLAEVISRQNEEAKARHFLDLAHEVSPSSPENDPSYPFTHFSSASTSVFGTLVYLNLQQYSQAEQAFTRLNQIVPTDVVPTRLELQVHQTMLACSRNDLEQTADLVESALPMAQSLGSHLRADQLYDIYEEMLKKWQGEARVNELSELFQE